MIKLKLLGGGGGPFPGAIDVAAAPADGYTIGSFVPAVPVIVHETGINELATKHMNQLAFS